MNPHETEKNYVEIKEYSNLLNLLNEYLIEYNSSSKDKLDILFFEEAVITLSKINRILGQNFGNGLFIGLGGSGRRTLTRLACFMQDYKLFSLEVDHDITMNEWKDFLRQILLYTGKTKRQATFLISENQIIDEKFLEDVNNILNIGEIPNLFVGDEKENLIAELKEVADREKKPSSPIILWEEFVNKCKVNLHTVLCLSPIGDKLRLRMRSFPSLINCTGVIWFKAWKNNSLFTIANEFLNSNNSLDIYKEKFNSISSIFVEMHQSMIEAAQNYRKSKKYYYVTPINYTILLKNFERILLHKQQELTFNRDKYMNGVNKLQEVSGIVAQMKIMLEEKRPRLIAKNKEAEVAVQQMKLETEESVQKGIEVEKDKERLKEYANKCLEIQNNCTQKLTLAEPELKEAEAQLYQLQASDFLELTSYKKPGEFVTATMEAVLKLLGIMPKSNQKEIKKWFWETAKKKLSTGEKFKQELIAYKAEMIKETSIQAFEEFLEANKNYDVKSAKKVTKAVILLCSWSLSLYKYYQVYVSILPLREDLAKANAEMEKANNELKDKIKLLDDINIRINKLSEELKEKNAEKNQLTQEIRDCEIKCERALKLTKELASEKIRWLEQSQTISQEIVSVLGDIMISVGCISYFGAFTENYRVDVLKNKWLPAMEKNKIDFNPEFSISNTLGVPIDIFQWNQCGLPSDKISVENILIMKNSVLYPLAIDPQKQFTKFIKNYEEKENNGVKNKVTIIKPSPDLANTLEYAVRMGEALIIENVGETLDPALEQFIAKGSFFQAGLKCVTIMGRVIELHNNFRLYMICGLPNPHYFPELLTKVLLLNFTITQESLKEQMLTTVSKKEEPKDEEEKLRINHESMMNKQTLKILEDRILSMLNSGDSSSFLDDEALVSSLTEAKSTSEEIQTRMIQVRFSEQKINNNRKNYDQLSVLVANHYFWIMELPNLDPMYYFSLAWFEDVFKKAIDLAEKPVGKNISLRITYIEESFNKFLYRELSRSLFVKHKQLLAFTIVLTNLRTKSKIQPDEWKLFVSNNVEGENTENNQEDDIAHLKNNQNTSREWALIKIFDNLKGFNGIKNKFLHNSEAWLDYIKNMENYNQMIDGYNKLLSPFQTLLFTKIFRFDLFTQKISTFIKEELGEYFNSPILFTLSESHEISNYAIPLLFLLSPGDDPQEELKKFASEKGKILTPISLGRGQGVKALKTIKECIQIVNGPGVWILLQNCHLATAWLPNLQVFLDGITKETKVNPEFRLWMTSMSSSMFPKPILENCIKITKDPPKGVKANLMQLYLNQNSTKSEKEFYYSISDHKQEEWRALFMSLGYFHSIIRERRRYGSIGWNNYYEFNDSDFKISVKQLHFMIKKYSKVPYKALSYLTAECYYGGRVTDDWDRRLIKTLLQDFYTDKAVTPEYYFSEIPEYTIGENLDIDNSLNFISNLPDINTPILYGLHPNAAIIAAKNDAIEITNSVIDLTSIIAKNTEESRQSELSKLIQSIIESLPELFQVSIVNKKYPLTYEKSMNTVLTQEILRYNTLNQLMRQSLKTLKESVEGLIPSTSELEQMSDNILKNKIPVKWSEKSYPSLKSFLGFIDDFKKRCNLFEKWIKHGEPTVFWVSGFYFTQSFFTGVLQTYARKHNISIDKIKMSFQVREHTFDPEKQPADGCYINGLYLDGAGWDEDKHTLQEQQPKQIYYCMPTIQILLSTDKSRKYYNLPKDYFLYKCPIYKTSERRGTLSTTGHSTNFILSVRLPSNKMISHWVKRGTALLTQLNEQQIISIKKIY